MIGLFGQQMGDWILVLQLLLIQTERADLEECFLDPRYWTKDLNSRTMDALWMLLLQPASIHSDRKLGIVQTKPYFAQLAYMVGTFAYGKFYLFVNLASLRVETVQQYHEKGGIDLRGVCALRGATQIIIILCINFLSCINLFHI